MRLPARPTVLLLSLLALASPLAAQLPGISLGAGARYANPSGDFGKAVDAGYGGYLKAELGAVLIGVAGEVNLTRFSGAADADAVSVFGAQVGPRLGLGLVKAGFDVGWYSKVKKTGYSPNLSIALGPLEGGAGITFFSGGRWLYLRAGLRF